MPSWYFDKTELKKTPSAAAGIDYESESKYRREGAKFIMDVGNALNLRYDTMATGAVYFHRFFMFHSFKEFHYHVVALGCLFLAGKVEETPKKCKDIIRVARDKLTDSQFSALGEDPKEEIMTLERILLQTIKFDLQVEHPYMYLLKYAKVVKGDKVKLNSMVQMAWTFINDSLCTTLCLQWEPEVIAIALMYLASRLTKFEVLDWTGKKNVKGEKWWDQFVEDISMDLLEGSDEFDICHTILDLYSSNSKDKKPALPGSSPPVSTTATSGCSGVSTAVPSTMAVVRSDATKLPTLIPTVHTSANTVSTPTVAPAICTASAVVVQPLTNSASTVFASTANAVQCSLALAPPPTISDSSYATSSAFFPPPPLSQQPSAGAPASYGSMPTYATPITQPPLATYNIAPVPPQPSLPHSQPSLSSSYGYIQPPYGSASVAPLANAYAGQPQSSLYPPQCQTGYAGFAHTQYFTPHHGGQYQ